jgi:FHS family glucose/mannose:H+ symporter-like MFS transporter
VLLNLPQTRTTSSLVLLSPLTRRATLCPRSFELVMPTTSGSTSAASSDSTSGLTAFVHAGFVVAGAVTILLGPILPMLAARWSLKDAETGYFFLAQFLTAILGSAISSFAIPRWGYKKSFLASFCLIGIGVGALGHFEWIGTLAAISIYGAGLGFLSPATNLWIGEAAKTGRAGALNLINFSWTAGAMLCPFLVALTSGSGHLNYLLYAFTVAAAALAIASVFLPLDLPITIEDPAPESATSASPAHTSYLALTVLFGVVFFLHLGSENAIGGWVASYSHRILDPNSRAWIITPSLFWGGLLAGRAVAPAILKRVSEIRVVQFAFGIAIVGVAILISANGFVGIAAGTFIAGAGVAPVFASLMSWMVRAYGPAARALAGQLLGVGILGGACVPWGVGILSTHFGSLKYGLALVLFTLVSTLSLASLLNRLSASPVAPAHQGAQ